MFTIKGLNTYIYVHKGNLFLFKETIDNSGNCNRVINTDHYAKAQDCRKSSAEPEDKSGFGKKYQTDDPFLFFN